jgi:UDP-N-acetylmuramoyl-L-alanyl-D-glutamate--2,6-diaminopimelate ligase
LVLGDVLKNINVREVFGPLDLDIEGTTEDSRKVGPGYLFAAVEGVNFDGRRFVDDAVKRGATAILAEGKPQADLSATWIQVDDSKLALAKAAANFFDNPSKEMRVVGVTGTNGKTTVSYIVKDILEAAGGRCGLIGTVEYSYREQALEATRTTPDAPTLHKLLRKMRDGGADAVVMEVSSHALDQRRVDGVDFDAGIFTNLTRDHLDYHQTMEEYLAAKERLFTELVSEKADHFCVINVDDDAGRDIADRVNSRCVTYGIKNAANIGADKLQLCLERSVFTVTAPEQRFRIESGLLGRHNVYNCLAAIACGIGFGIDPDIIKSAVENVKRVPGRMERVENDRGLNVFVDYAHTDDALENVLTTLREITDKKIIVVFGCGGDRDRGKRPKMGKVASMQADFSVITTDNPRSENPGSIAAEVEAGFDGDGGRYVVEIDRREAIKLALEKAGDGDAVLIAGKGHENYQVFNDRTEHFDDRETVEELLTSISHK